MKFIPIVIAFLVVCELAIAQLVVPEPPPPRAVGNSAMLIKFGGQRIEVLPSNRAVRNPNGQYTVVVTNPAEPITKDKLGVGYSYASNSKVLLSGEINFKLKLGFSAASLGSIAVDSKLVASPDMYLFTPSTPLDLVRTVGVLQANPAVEWVEPFIVRARIN